MAMLYLYNSQAHIIIIKIIIIIIIIIMFPQKIKRINQDELPDLESL